MNTFGRINSTHEEWKIVDKFDSAYWSGLDAQIYFNNILINEALQINYMVSEQVRPYFGYASHVASRIHHGARIVQGEITMNYKRDGYLFSLLNLIRQQQSKDIWLADQGISSTASPEARAPVAYNNTPYGPDLWDQIKTTGLPGNVAKEIALNKYRASRESVVNSREAIILQSRGAFETKLEGFDINITFGANLSAAHSLRWLDGDDFELDPINSLYADGWVVQNSDGVIASTGIKLIGVSIGGLSKTINDDGRPIVETYAFQAKDIVVLKNVDTRDETSRKAGLNALQSPVSSAKDPIHNYSNGVIGQESWYRPIGPDRPAADIN